MEPRNVLVVGGQKKCWEPILKYLAQCGFQIHSHWNDDSYLNSKIPKNVDLLIMITSQISHALYKYAKDQASKHAKLVVSTDHHFAKFPEQLAKWGIGPLNQSKATQFAVPPPERISPLVPIETILIDSSPTPSPMLNHAAQQYETQPAVMVAAPKEEKKAMAKMRKNSEQKVDFIKELLKRNPFESPPSINRKVAEKFPSSHPNRVGGVAVSLISKIRLEEEGIRFGPRGIALDKKGKHIEIPEKYVRMNEEERASMDAAEPKNGHAKKPTSIAEVRQQNVAKFARQSAEETEHEEEGSVQAPAQVAAYRTQRRPEAEVGASNDRLRQLMSQLRSYMESEGIQELIVPVQGSVQARRISNVSLDV